MAVELTSGSDVRFLSFFAFGLSAEDFLWFRNRIVIGLKLHDNFVNSLSMILFSVVNHFPPFHQLITDFAFQFLLITL